MRLLVIFTRAGRFGTLKHEHCSAWISQSRKVIRVETRACASQIVIAHNRYGNLTKSQLGLQIFH